jgi:hypothetical protein
MAVAQYPAGQSDLDSKSHATSPANTDGLLQQYRQSLLRELAEVERLIAEREDVVARKAVR